MCVNEQPNMRPNIADVVTALTYLASQKYDPDKEQGQSFHSSPGTPPRMQRNGTRKHSGRGGAERDQTRKFS